MRTRTFIRERFACEPGGCGARPGQTCVAYVPKRGRTTGNPTADVHAARWKAFHAWLNRDRADHGRRQQMTNEDEILAMAGVTREDLGRRVRARWLEWARQQPDALEHPHWLIRYSALDQRDREVDDEIGTDAFIAGWLAARKAYR